MTQLSPGCVVRIGPHGYSLFVVVSHDENGDWVIKNNGHTRTAKASALRLVRPVPVYQVAQRVTFQGNSWATIQKDLGDKVELTSGMKRHVVPKADLVLMGML